MLGILGVIRRFFLEFRQKNNILGALVVMVKNHLFPQKTDLYHGVFGFGPVVQDIRKEVSPNKTVKLSLSQRISLDSNPRCGALPKKWTTSA